MFGNDKNATPIGKRGATAKDGGVTILTAGCHFSGKLYCRGATRIGGTIDGQVIAEGLLVIEDEAVVSGDIQAEEIVVHGRIEGKVEGLRRVEMCATADIQADVGTPSLVIHDGALFNGKTTMKRQQAESSTTKSGGKGVKVAGGHKASTPPSIEIRNDSKVDVRAARIPDISFGEPEPAI